MLLAGFVAFLVLLILFFFRVKTIRLKIALRATPVIEFYRHRKEASEIDDFLEQLRLRQGIVSQSPAALVHRSAGFTKEQSLIPRFAALLWLASLPALMTQPTPAALLPVGVLIWFAYRRVQYARQPREYPSGDPPLPAG